MNGPQNALWQAPFKANECALPPDAAREQEERGRQDDADRHAQERDGAGADG
jgi:hypothetical protein